MHDLRQGLRNLGVAGIRIMQCAIDLVFADGSMEGGLDLRSRAAKDNTAAGGRHLADAHPMPLQPGRGAVYVRLRYAKPLPELFRGQPVMVVGRTGIFLSPQQLLENRLLRVVRLQEQNHPLHRVVGRNSSHLILGPGQRMPMSGEYNPLLVIDRFCSSVDRTYGKQVCRSERALRGCSWNCKNQIQYKNRQKGA